MDAELNLDCRGLPAAIAVLRIKLALHSASDDDPHVRAQLGEACCADAVLSGLRADASCVRLV